MFKFYKLNKKRYMFIKMELNIEVIGKETYIVED